MPIIVLSAGEIKLFPPVGGMGKRLVIAIQCDGFYHRGICLEGTKKGSEALLEPQYLKGGRCVKSYRNLFSKKAPEGKKEEGVALVESEWVKIWGPATCILTPLTLTLTLLSLRDHGEHRGPTEPILKSTGLDDAGKSPPPSSVSVVPLHTRESWFHILSGSY